MLKSINIQNIALIEALSLDFGRGLNVLSGETGAGKSILIDAVNLVLGERADRELIRRGTDRASVEAYFSCDDVRVREALNEIGIEADDEVVLSRELTASGRNIARINGTLVNNAALKAVSTLLIDIHGQHQHQSIFDPKAHIGLLDAYCGEDLLSPKLEYARAMGELKAIAQEQAQLGGDVGERERKKDMLRFAIDEITGENIVKGEEEQLEKDQMLMANAERISYALEEAYGALYGVDDTPGAIELLGAASKAMVQISDYGEEYGTAAEELNSLYYQAEASVELVRQLKYNFYFDPAALEATERRLADLQRIKRKYGGSIDAVLEYLSQCEEELYQLEHSEELLNALIIRENIAIRTAYDAAVR
ncbi:MAG: DNA repair protein RecN, partial [Clostridiales bacterium]|nr:DNA repair protein RecN [Clostridiales bacterium]